MGGQLQLILPCSCWNRFWSANHSRWTAVVEWVWSQQLVSSCSWGAFALLVLKQSESLILSSSMCLSRMTSCALGRGVTQNSVQYQYLETETAKWHLAINKCVISPVFFFLCQNVFSKKKNLRWSNCSCYSTSIVIQY